MSPRKTATDADWIRKAALVLGFALALALAPSALGHPVTAEGGPEACATVEGFSGSAQILDETRTAIHEVGEIRQVPCEGWVSVDEGWVRLVDRNGHEIRLGEGTFVQLTAEADELVLFRGEVYGKASRGVLRVITPNLRARVSRGSLLVLFDPGSEESQVVALDRAVEVENRFVRSHRVRVMPGTLSELDFKLLRVLPRMPRPVEPGSLEAALSELNVAAEAREAALKLARIRIQQNKVKIARAGTAVGRGRAPAGLVFDQDGAGARKEAAKQVSPGASSWTGSSIQRLARQVVGGEPQGVRLLFPGSHAGARISGKGRGRAGPRIVAGARRSRARSGSGNPAAGPAGIAVASDSGGRHPALSRDEGDSSQPDADAEESAEKRRLIEELSTIQTE